MDNEQKKSKISLSKPEDIPSEQPDYNYDGINSNEYQGQDYQQSPPQQLYNTQYSQSQQNYNTQYSEPPRRLNPNIPRSYQQNNSPMPRNDSPFQNSNYVRNIQGNPNAMKYCKFCGYSIPFDAVVCTACGRQVEQLNQGANYYQQNNTYINNVNVNNGNVSNKSRSTAGILCALGFLGFGGLHRFYTGHIFSGTVYLLTYGLLGIGTVVDLMRLLRGTFSDSHGRQLKD